MRRAIQGTPSNPQPSDDDWQIISSYTDSEAVADGELIDLGH